MNSLVTPHDRFFRESFARREIAQDFMRHHLTAEFLAEIDLDSLAIAKDSYVSKELRKAYSDLVYRVRMRDGELQIYLLFEHKSRPEHWTLLQLLRYAVAADDEYRNQHLKARRLPPVYPLVLFHGRAQWRVPASFHELAVPSPTHWPPMYPNSASLCTTSPRAPTPRSAASCTCAWFNSPCATSTATNPWSGCATC